MIYLAIPYTGTKEQMQERYTKAVKACAELMKHGLNVFSPIVHSHPIAQQLNNDTDCVFWLRKDQWFLKRCDVIAVLALEGYEKSKGVEHEVSFFLEHGKPVYYLREGEFDRAIGFLRSFGE